MSAIIFYGAGKYAEENLARWAKQGLVPVCFADSDKSKQDMLFGGVPILSLDDAIAAYPDYVLYLTVNYVLYKPLTDILSQKLGIPLERIKYPVPVEYRLGCGFIGTRLQFFGEVFSTCCATQKTLIPYDEDIRANFRKYDTSCHQLIDDLRSNKKTACDNCAQLRSGIWPIEPELTTVGFDSAFAEDRCNFKCIYCPALHSLTERSFSVRLVDLLLEFERISGGAPRNIIFASGEIGVSPYRDEALDIVARNHWRVTVFTNASIFLDKLEALISAKRAGIQVSMDSGTPETFAAIKGVDCYCRVVDNLRKYAQNAAPGQIQLKYILLPDVNDNINDIDGFAALAREINANVFISCDMRYVNLPLPQNAFDCILRLTEKCRDNGTKFTLVTEFFNPSTYKRLNELLFLQDGDYR